MIRVRPYKSEDRAALEAICCATALRGQLDSIFCDRFLFAKLWLSPYLDVQPDNAFTVEYNGEVAGYLVSYMADDFESQALRANRRWIAILLWKWITGQYRHHPQSCRFIGWLFCKAWKENPRTPRNSAHFHFNLAQEVRGTDVGQLLVEMFEQRLCELGRKRWHAVLFSSPDYRPLRLYRRLGFTVYDSKPCSLFPTATEIACIVKEGNRALTALFPRPQNVLVRQRTMEEAES